VLVAAHAVRDEFDLTVAEHDNLQAALSWFNDHLVVPAILENPENRRAISWFKPAAAEAIKQMWQLKNLLDLHGLHVEVVRTLDPGAIVYEDDWQVIAKPPKRATSSPE
jgi:hypothetical protein